MAKEEIIQVPQKLFKQVGGWATVFTIVAVTYYILGGYKYFLEVKEINNRNGAK